nr:Chain K, Spindle pole body component 110 [Saccharomyces cerevisiae S288C]7M2W_U Chain U, Spindle pole body component 110 [Saccharomyces cerevisiae S288C]7M2W_X Chain X, Spindle pole body component 110 [Saccharomyces cerevisiae S288C]7M2W_Y Chain Y, Spindle pole body component 110 [Saccharomyces cerevisiae S288C]7M2X_U Chain U, Spindle pole body component 110 [Saccharomyces cerevisiae S288C]7M2Y_U Chain U, Spindle pole body component 110 [Saccharomyces cerevisiae S288C]
MDEASHLPNGSLKNMEFTPVGFIKSKRNTTQTQVVSPTKVPNANNGDENEGPVKKRQRRSIDDTIDSTRLFSEASQFDDSFPEIKANIPPSPRSGNVDKSRKRNLIDDLKKDVPMSQPLKEQEVREHQMKKERFDRALESKLLGKRHITYANSDISNKELYINEIKSLKHEIKELRKEKNDTLNNYDTLEEETDDLKNRLQALEKELDAKNKIVNSRKVD